MKIKKIFLLVLPLLLLSLLVGCEKITGISFKAKSTTASHEDEKNNATTESSSSIKPTIITTKSNEELEVIDNTNYTITYESGSENCYSVQNNTITFSGITEKSVYNIEGEFNGNIIIDVTEDYKFELVLNGFTLVSYSTNPILIASGDKVTISAKNETENFVYDKRDTIDDTDETLKKGAIYAACDLDIQGKGTLNVISTNNNGIHTKDDLNIKNLTLNVESVDNAIKGNDSVTIESGTLNLIAKQGDGIKTSNSDVSSKGNQRGDITITGGSISISAATDGIDASHDAIINESTSIVNINILTDKYSEYSEEVTKSSSSIIYIRYTSKSYNYSILYSNDNGDTLWKNAEFYKQVSTGRSNYYYYTVEKPSGYTKMKAYIYTSSQTQGQDTSYAAQTKVLTINENYDTLALSTSNSTLKYSWTNYTTESIGGGGFNPGGMNDGNTDKSDYSTKGIKADNEIVIDAGTINIKSYDDAIHANNDNTLENGLSPLGNVTINGGNLTLYSNDDGIHADNSLLITNGNIKVTNCYEGIEGLTITVEGGNISVVSSDDGFNSTATTGTGMTFTGGNIYVYAGGDGLDSNTKTKYTGFIIDGANIVSICTSRDNSALDTESGYTYNSGKVVAISTSGGMSNENVNCSNFSKIGKYATISLTKGSYVQVKSSSTITAVVKSPVAISAIVVYLGDSSASITKVTSTTVTLDDNGVYFN